MLNAITESESVSFANNLVFSLRTENLVTDHGICVRFSSYYLA